MATTTYTDDVQILGTENEVQLVVQGNSPQTVALQQWQDSTASVLAELREDGRLRVGGDLGLSAPSALIEANQTLTASSGVKRGLQSLGQLSGAFSEALAWAVHELQLIGSGAVSGLQTAWRIRLVFDNSGDASQAELRAIHAEAINQQGTLTQPTARLASVHATLQNMAGESQTAYAETGVAVVAELINSADSTLNEGIGVEIPSPVNEGNLNTAYGLKIADFDTATTNYAIHTAKGLVHLGDVVELGEVSEPATPPAGLLRLYAQADGKIYIKNSAGETFDLTASGSGGGGNPTQDYLTIKTTNRSGATTQIGQVGSLIYNGWHNPSLSSDYAPQRPAVALESVADGASLYVAIFGRVTAIGDEAIPAEKPLKLSVTNPGRLVKADYWSDHVIAMSVTACSGAGAFFSIDLFGDDVQPMAWILGHPVLSRLGVTTILG